MVVRGDTNVAGRLVTQLGQSGQFHVDLFQPRPDGTQQALPRLGWRDAACRARQQPQPETALKAAKGLAQPDCETPRCAAARVKLCSRATARKATISLKSVRGIEKTSLSPQATNTAVRHPLAGNCARWPIAVHRRHSKSETTIGLTSALSETHAAAILIPDRAAQLDSLVRLHHPVFAAFCVITNTSWWKWRSTPFSNERFASRTRT